jgi:hypothetical protein
MKKYVHFKFALLFSVLSLIIFSCTDQACLDNTQSLLTVTFYNNVGVPKTLDSLTIYGLNMGTNKLYSKALKIKSAVLPLNASTDSCIFVMKINNITDTIEFKYSSYPHLVSKECGYTFYHELDTGLPLFTKHSIVNMLINTRNITTINADNIRIFL